MKALKSLLAIMAVIMCTSFSISTAQAYDGSREDIALSGSAQREYAPDMAYVYFSIIGSGKSSEEAAAAAADKAAAVKHALLMNGITSDALETNSYNMNPVYNNKQKVIGYRVDNSLKLRIDKLDKLGNTIDKLAAAGIDTVNYISFDLRNRKLFMQQLAGEAVQNARSQAQVIAAAGGRSVGRMLHANFNTSYGAPRLYSNMKTTRAADRAQAETVIETKDISLSANVDVVFALQ